MAILNTIAPTYKTADTANTAAAPPAVNTCGLSGLFGSLLGNATPVYKTVGGQSAQMPASGCVFGLFPAAPSYKTAPAVASSDDDPTVALDVGECVCVVPDDPCDAPDVREADEVVLL